VNGELRGPVSSFIPKIALEAGSTMGEEVKKLER
jgi:hypothetical protein